MNIDGFTLNKIAGWVLFTALLVFGLKELAHAVYHTEEPEKPGMMVEVAEAATDKGSEGAHKAAEPEPIGPLLASANVENGQKAAKACAACHTFEKGGPDKVGPNLWGIVGRNIGSKEGFAYSNALKDKASEQWTFDALNHFLLKPKAYAPGTKMGYAGVKKDDQRADVIAYLRSLSDSPVPLPE